MKSRRYAGLKIKENPETLTVYFSVKHHSLCDSLHLIKNISIICFKKHYLNDLLGKMCKSFQGK